MAGLLYRVTGLFELERAYTQLSKACATGEARAVRRTGVTIIAAQSRAVVARVALKVSRVKEAVRVAQQPTPEAPRIVIEVKRRVVGLVEYTARWTGRKSAGATAVVLRAQGRHTFPGTFIRVGLNGNRQVFERTGKFGINEKGRYAGKRREKLKALYGPSVFSQFKREDIQAVGVKTWSTALPINLQRELKFALSKVGG